jgi:RNA polymerase sigma factor (sigma-70 family)
MTEDLASQTFLKIAEKLGTYKSEKGALSTWIFTIALNEMRSYYRSQKGKIQIALEDITELPSDVSLEEDYKLCEEKKAIIALLHDLDERQHNMITLKYFGDLSNKEIGEILGLTETNVSAILNRTLQKLKKAMCDETHEFAYKR